jgi:YHS domain-containing protein
MDTIKVNLLEHPLHSMASLVPATPLAADLRTSRDEQVLPRPRAAHPTLLDQPAHPTLTYPVTPAALTTPAACSARSASAQASPMSPAAPVVGGRLLVLAALAACVVLGRQTSVRSLGAVSAPSKLAAAAAPQAQAPAAVQAAPLSQGGHLLLVDPVCGHSVNPASSPFVATVGGTTVYFDGESCRQRFESNPLAYAKVVHHVRFSMASGEAGHASAAGASATRTTQPVTQHPAAAPAVEALAAPQEPSAAPQASDLPAATDDNQPTFAAPESAPTAAAGTTVDADAPSVVENAPFAQEPAGLQRIPVR